jgi:hypothetical protein
LTGANTDYLKRFGDAFEGLATGQKRVLIQGLVKEVVVNGKDDCRVVLTIPLPSETQSAPESAEGGPLDEDRPLGYPWTLPAKGVPVHLSALNGVPEGA